MYGMVGVWVREGDFILLILGLPSFPVQTWEVSGSKTCGRHKYSLSYQNDIYKANNLPTNCELDIIFGLYTMTPVCIGNAPFPYGDELGYA